MTTPEVNVPPPKSNADVVQAPAKSDGKASKTTRSNASATPRTKARTKASAAPAKTPKNAGKEAAKTPAVEMAAADNAARNQATPESKPKRAKKEKVVRDSFTMPKSDYAKIATLKQKCQDNGVRVKKSELLRAALTMLEAAPDKRLVEAIKALETVKTGRPANT
ncbi:hypothetical protein [Paraburkholderia sacchari]|uniref:hypothetical protein n=1 Tax=Paraburkholderia sacchari TaxID=159450 RepID=UPI000543229C|nr:hypothetical protein [Paraburkholderia sacchari]NLP64771.1 hypothetical protein [Paraburkholderia sacchari]